MHQSLVGLIFVVISISLCLAFSVSIGDTQLVTGRLLPMQATSHHRDAQSSTSSSGDRGVGTAWSPSSWKKLPILQAPKYLDEVAVTNIVQTISRSPPLVLAHEVCTLQEQLARVSAGQSFLLMGGDCAETFKEFSTEHIRNTMRVIMQMAVVITFGGCMPVVKIGRMAGQFAKPRSEPDETIGGVTLPSYRGDIINAEAFTAESRVHDPRKMLDAYHQSIQTMNILRACLSTRETADLSKLHAANLHFARRFVGTSKHKELYADMEKSFEFMRAVGVDLASPLLTQTQFFTAHECLLLPYEEALTRKDGSSQRWYDLSAHMLWIGERTRQLDHAHMHFVSGIENPMGIKLSEKTDLDELVRLLDLVNPNNVPGRVVLIVRMGAEKLRERLPSLIRAVQRDGRSVVWCSDPLHSNTVKTAGGYKTRPFERICAEVQAFFDVHAELGTHPGGVHLEMTGADVTECLGGAVNEVLQEHLGRNYLTACDPRLNADQALELAFIIADHMRAARDKLFGL